MANVAWGIDIGGSAIKVARLARTKQGLEVQALDSFALAVDPAADQTARNQQITQLLDQLRVTYKFRGGDEVWVSLPGQTVFQRSISIFGADAANLRGLVLLEAQQQIPSAIEEIVWDFHVNSPQLQAHEDTDITLYAVKRENLDYFLQWWAQAGIRISGIQWAPLADFNYLRYEHPDEGPCLLLDIGAENSDLVLCGPRKATIRSVTIAGIQMTRALERKFKIPFAEAEKLKVEATKPQYERHAEKIYETVKPRLQELTDEINRSVGYFQSQGESQKFETLYITGLGTRLLGTKHFFSERFSYQVEKLDALQRLTASAALDVTELKKNLGAFSVALGLAIQGLGESVNRINLLPPEVVAQRAKARRLPAAAAAMALVLVALLADWRLTARETDAARALAAETKRRKDAVTAEIDRYRTVSNLDPVQFPFQVLARIGDHRHLWPTVHDVLVRSLDAFNTGERTRAAETGREPLTLKLLSFELDARPLNFHVLLTRPAPHRTITQIAEEVRQGRFLQGPLQELALKRPGAPGSREEPMLTVEVVARPVPPGAPPAREQWLHLWLPTHLSPQDPAFEGKLRKAHSAIIEGLARIAGGTNLADDEAVAQFGLVIREHAVREWDLDLTVGGRWDAERAEGVRLAREHFWDPLRAGLRAVQPAGERAGLLVARVEEPKTTLHDSLRDVMAKPPEAPRGDERPPPPPGKYLRIQYRGTLQLRAAGARCEFCQEEK